MRIFSFLLALILMTTPAAAFDRLTDTFEPDALSFQEKRVLQAMLAADGNYTSRLDGAWGRGSHSALEKALTSRFGKGAVTWERVALFARESEEAMETARWAPVFVDDTGTSFIIPSAMIALIANTKASYASSDGGLRINNFPTDELEAKLAHLRIAAREHDSNPLYRVSRKGLHVTSGRLNDTTYVYLRTEILNGVSVNTLVNWSEANAKTAQLVVSSIQQGPQEDLRLNNGLLRRAVAWLDKPAKPNAPANTQPPSSKLALSGVGIYINNTDLLVPQIVVDGCKGGLHLADGTPLQQTERLQPMDLVVMSSTRRSANWMRIHTGDLDKNSSLTAFFIPDTTWASGRTSTISATLLGGFTLPNGKKQHLTTLPAQMQYLGAPLLNLNNELAGVLQGKPDLSALRGTQDIPPRRFSVAVSTYLLSPLLHRRAIVHQRAATQASATATDPAKAIVPVACAG